MGLTDQQLPERPAFVKGYSKPEVIVPPQYLTDASGFKGFADRIFSPADDRELVAILEAAMTDRVPVTVAGAGSGLTGSRVPQGGWVLSLEKFRRLETATRRRSQAPP
jgi:FAD/FMN-containing dehydrogenase